MLKVGPTVVQRCFTSRFHQRESRPDQGFSFRSERGPQGPQLGLGPQVQGMTGIKPAGFYVSALGYRGGIPLVVGTWVVPKPQPPREIVARCEKKQWLELSRTASWGFTWSDPRVQRPPRWRGSPAMIRSKPSGFPLTWLN